MKIAIIGYGKMGREVENIARETEIEIASRIDPVAEEADFKEISKESIGDADVCIDFTQPETAIPNLEKISELGKNTVIGTTGWYEQEKKARKIVEKAGTGCIYASNFSIGVNLFFRMVKEGARLLNCFPEYDCFAVEQHHKRKKDSPSGTAKSIGDILLKELDSKDKIETGRLDRQIDERELHLASVRGGHVPGTHSVFFDSEADTIELKHTARNRKGFATGAVKAAEWIKGKKGFFSIDDMMKEILDKGAKI